MSNPDEINTTNEKFCERFGFTETLGRNRNIAYDNLEACGVFTAKGKMYITDAISLPGTIVDFRNSISVTGIPSQGPQGEQGQQGSTGPTGAPGKNGPVGLQGLRGPQGSKGPAGSTGPTGPTGLTGFQGIILTGFDGEVGPQGPTGIEDGTNGSLITYRPGTASSPDFFAFETWAEVMTAATANGIPKEIIFDDTYGSPVTVPSGTHTFTTPTVFRGLENKAGYTVVDFGAEAIFECVTRIQDSLHICSTSVGPLFTFSAASKLVLRDRVRLESSTVPIFRFSGGVSHLVHCADGVLIDQPTGAFGIFDVIGAGTTVNMSLFENCTLPSKTFQSAASTTVNFNYVEGSVTVDGQNGGINFGTFDAELVERATLVKFDPTVRNYYPSSVDTVQKALEAIVANPAPAGPTGPRGPLGSKGPDGPMGPPGEDGPTGATGLPGSFGSQGPTGPKPVLSPDTLDIYTLIPTFFTETDVEAPVGGSTATLSQNVSVTISRYNETVHWQFEEDIVFTLSGPSSEVRFDYSSLSPDIPSSYVPDKPFVKTVLYSNDSESTYKLGTMKFQGGATRFFEFYADYPFISSDSGTTGAGTYVIKPFTVAYLV